MGSNAHAKSQLITLDSGEVVRYFTEDQLEQLQRQLLERDACIEQIPLYESIIETQEDSIERLESLASLTSTYGERDERTFLFCESRQCSYAVGVLTGLSAAMTIMFVTR